jgi:hypothetical protein
MFRTPTFDPCFINNKDGNYHSGCNVKISLNLGLRKRHDYEKKRNKKKGKIKKRPSAFPIIYAQSGGKE